MDSNEILLLNQEPEPLSVSIICHLITKTVKPLLNDIQIIGEIGEYKVNEHVYFRLYDPNILDQSKSVFLEMVIWKRQWYEIQKKLPRNFQLDKGKKVIITGTLSFFQGKLRCEVKTLELTEEGRLHFEYLQLCEKLKPLFTRPKPPLPFLPQHIAIISSEKAQGYEDVLSTWKNHFQNGQKIPFQYTLFPCNVQGKDASQSMIIALERIYKMYLNKDNAYSYADTDIDHLSSTNLRIDCILMVRGGGSWHDLSGFNDEQLALTMAKSPLCIITGVGHSTDFTIAQKMASIQADTPTASAAVILKRWDFVFREYEGLKTQFNYVFQKRLDQDNQRLQQYQQRFITQQKRFFQTQQTILNNYSQKLHRVYQQKIADKQQDCRMLSERLINLTKQRINHEQQQTMFMKQKLLQSQLAIQHQLKSYQLELALLKSKLEHANPRALINKGFAVILPPKNQGNKLKISIRDFPLKQSFRIVLKDGIVTGETIFVEEREYKKS